MASTPNFNWSTPDNTGLVKNGALDIRTLGNAIDASLVDLKGGATGQVLAKATNTDMDFTWVAQDDSNAIQNAIVDAKGDLIGATANDTPARLAVGANGTMLVANSAESTGLKWTTATDQFPWQTWTPTYTRLTIGNGTVVARYQQIGKTVNFFWKLTWGSTTSLTNFPCVSLPVNSRESAQHSIGNATLHDISVGQYTGIVSIAGSDIFLISSQSTSGAYSLLYQVDTGTPATWVTGDIWTCVGSYEAA